MITNITPIYLYLEPYHDHKYYTYIFISRTLVMITNITPAYMYLRSWL